MKLINHIAIIISTLIVFFGCDNKADHKIYYFKDIYKNTPQLSINNGRIHSENNCYIYENRVFLFRFPDYLTFSDSIEGNGRALLKIFRLDLESISSEIEIVEYHKNKRNMIQSEEIEKQFFGAKVLPLSNKINGFFHFSTKVDQTGDFDYQLIFEFYVDDIAYGIIFDGFTFIDYIAKSYPEYFSNNRNSKPYTLVMGKEFVDGIITGKDTGIALDMYCIFLEIINSIEIKE